MPNSISLLADVIENAQPKKIVAVGDTAGKLTQSWCEAHADCLQIEIDTKAPERALSAHNNIDLAIVSDTLEHQPQIDGERLLALLRNYGTHQIAVGVSENSGWSFNQFIALGFRKHATLTENEQQFTLYTYNLDNYNHKRTWNNPRFWANPEMWGKSHW